VVAVLACAVAACNDDDATSPTTELRIGVLADTTASGATLGAHALRAARAAAEDFDAASAGAANPARVRLIVQDTRFDPAQAADAVDAMHGQGVRIAIGPQSSAEVLAAKQVADAEGVLLFSYGSTARSLALPGDNVLRLVPDDRQEGAAHAALMWGEGARVVVPLWRGDPGNDGLQASVKESIEALGGSVTAGVRYDPATEDFTAALSEVRTQVAAAVAAQGAGAVVVYLAAFEECATIFAQAANDPVLASVRWHGGDGTNQSAAVLSDPAAAGFAAAVDFRAATYGLDDALIAGERALLDRIVGPGAPPDPFALAAYDATMLAARALAASQGDDVAALRAELVSQANAYTGVTGPTQLNDAGDRASGDYDFYVVCAAGSSYTWERALTYRAADGSLVPREGCGTH
jgi:branched-chain amino acid transport system substrate-binding protein